MSNGQFENLRSIHINKIDLDLKNPRFGSRADEKECIEAILHGHEHHMMRLMKDIAANGLYPESIVVSQGDIEDKWIVRDGNRRLTALKLLHDPRKAPPALQNDIKKIKEANKAYPTRIDVVRFHAENDLQNFLKIKHTGFNEGIGQDSWSALAQAIYNERNGNPDPNIKAYKFLEWAKENAGIDYDDTFPITTLADRVMSKDRLEKIGFVFDDGNLTQIRDTTTTLNKVRQIINDINSQKISSRKLLTAAEQDNYIAELCTNHGNGELIISNSETVTTNDTSSKPNLERNENSPTKSASNPPPAQKTKADRQKLIYKKDIMLMGIPDTENKLHKILREISDLNVKSTPMAVAVLTRAVFELSIDHYIQLHSIKVEETFNKKIKKCAEHMHNASIINDDQFSLINKRTASTDDMLHFTTLHKYVHSRDFHPDYYRLNAFWDETEFFIHKCWKSY